MKRYISLRTRMFAAEIKNSNMAEDKSKEFLHNVSGGELSDEYTNTINNPKYGKAWSCY